MAVTANRMYNDPALGQAFSNLASAFGPPSGADLAGYATAGAKREEAARLAQLFTMAQSPEFDQSVFDRSNIAVGNYAPTSSFYAQDQNNSTTMRGQDIAASTSITNNTADNERAMMEAILGAATDPVSQGAIRPGFDPSAYGVPSVPAVPQFAGTPNPLSETEQIALERQGLIDGGLLTDELMLDTIIGDQTPVEVMTPSGPQYSTPGAAVRTGATPYDAPSGATETQNYQVAEVRDAAGNVVSPARTGTAYFDSTARTWKDTATQQALPQGAITYNSSLQGGSADTGLGATTANRTSSNNQAAEITSALNTLDIYEQLLRENPGALGIVGLIRGTTQNAVASATDLANAFGKSAPQIAEAAEDIRTGLNGIAPEMFDPSIPEAAFLQATLAYAIARTENPDGEVNRQAYERALDRVAGGLLGNSQEALANVGAYRKVLEAQLPSVGVLNDPSKARTDTSFQGGEDLPVVNSPEEAAQYPSGTRFKDPQGNIRTVP